MRKVTGGLVILACIICFNSIMGYLLKLDSGIDKLAAGDTNYIPDNIFQWYMPFNTLICFILLITAYLFSGSEKTTHVFISQLLAIAASLICVVHLMGYAYGADELITSAFYSKMSFPSSGTFIILATGIISLRPSSGFLSIITSDGLGAYITRRLLPVSFLIPVLFIWFRLITGSEHYMNSPMDLVLISTLYIGVFAFIVWKVANSVSKIERELKQLNTELEKRVHERTEQLLESNKELESFAYSVSHDLRAPLRHIIGFSEKLDSELTALNDPEITRITGKIKNASSGMSRLIDDLLSYSRLGRTELKTEQVSMNRIVKEIILNSNEINTKRKIEWKVQNLPDVKADTTRMTLVMQNLIDNAIKFTGKIDNAIVEIGVTDINQNEITFYVKDNGAGFNMAYSEKLFSVFQRLHSTQEFPGTGIGLATIRRIIGRFGGEVWAEGRENEGAIFYFTLPSHDL